MTGAGVYWHIVRDARVATIHPTNHRTVHNKHYPVQNASSGKAEKPCIIPISRGKNGGERKEQDAEKEVGCICGSDTCLITYTEFW